MQLPLDPDRGPGANLCPRHRCRPQIRSGAPQPRLRLRAHESTRPVEEGIHGGLPPGPPHLSARRRSLIAHLGRNYGEEVFALLVSAARTLGTIRSLGNCLTDGSNIAPCSLPPPLR